MSKSKSSIVRIILLVVCAVSLAGGIFSTVEIVQQNKICSENSAIVENYKKNYESESFNKLMEKYPGVSIFKDAGKNKLETAQKNIDKAEKNRIIFIVSAAVLYIAFAVCLVFSFKIGKSKKE